MSARDDIPAAERLSDKLMAGLRPEPPIDTTLFIPAERQKEMAFRATLPYCGREDVEAIIREAITETARAIKRHLASRPAQHEADRDRAAEEERIREDSWRPIADADNSIATIQKFGPVTLRNSHPIWARDADGRVYEAVWTVDDKKRGYWWDIEGESPVDPVEFYPHPLARAALRSSPHKGGTENG